MTPSDKVSEKLRPSLSWSDALLVIQEKDKEIDRLKSEVVRWQERMKRANELMLESDKKKDAEIQQLQIEKEEQYQSFQQWKKDYFKEMEQLKSEVERLKKRDEFICILHEGGYSSCPDCAKNIQQLRSEKERLIETLEKINKTCHGDAVVYSRIVLSDLREGRK